MNPVGSDGYIERPEAEIGFCTAIRRNMRCRGLPQPASNASYSILRSPTAKGLAGTLQLRLPQL